ncbi:MAG TPA: tail fiber protein [Xanthobacteraceae bacterium]|jgi:microcystin-dependent protein|nr:tail fiber protein [Xanthobacteraceae bacterium]
MDPFVAEIRIFPFNFPPKGWAFCDGQILPLSQNTALFSLLGTTYGGDGKSTFALPNLQGAAPMHPGQGPGLSLHALGEFGGSDAVTLLQSEIPAHTHTVNATTTKGSTDQPNGNLLGEGQFANQTSSGPVNYYTGATTPQVQMNVFATSPTGGNLPHNNMMPYLTLNFCIALQGVFPPRS